MHPQLASWPWGAITGILFPRDVDTKLKKTSALARQKITDYVYKTVYSTTHAKTSST